MSASARLVALNDRAPDPDGRYVLYWMQHSQRARNNPALKRAVHWANELKAPLLVLFVVDPSYPDANARHYTFMLEGLKETKEAIERRGAHFALRLGNPPDVAAQMAQDAKVVVTDRGYLRHLVGWRQSLADAAPVCTETVEGDVIVPVEIASPKQEIGARTLRPKLHRVLADFVEPLPPITLRTKAEGLGSDSDTMIDDIPAFLADLACDDSVGPVPDLKGGTAQALARLDAFVNGTLADYGVGRADIVSRSVSMLSPYLHFGQISPLDIYHAVQGADAPSESRASYVEEMLVRRELAVNFVHYAADYDSFGTLPGWAQETLAQHRDDPRETVYSPAQLEAGETDDPYWNAAMREMRLTGYLHNHLRMYWGKRLIAYTRTAEEAYDTALNLNNKYLLDGRDANSYANIGWLFGLHDRGWPERAVFGKVRTMTAGGLERKFDAKAYVRWVETLEE